MSKFKIGEEVDVIHLNRTVYVGFYKQNGLVKCRWYNHKQNLVSDVFHEDELTSPSSAKPMSQVDYLKNR